jgi:hypothetical protein
MIDVQCVEKTIALPPSNGDWCLLFAEHHLRCPVVDCHVQPHPTALVVVQGDRRISVITIPSWLPKQFVLGLQGFRPLLFNGETVCLALACSFHDYNCNRYLTAILYTLYHLTESSKTNQHGKYPILYTLLALCDGE